MSQINISHLLEFLYNWNYRGGKFIHLLQNTTHGNDERFNPHHMEGSIWTHTLLVLFQAHKYWDKQLEYSLAALLHDFGKAFVRTEKRKDDGTLKTHFINHGSAGTQVALDFLLDLREKYDISNEMIFRIISFVSNHYEFWSVKNSQEAIKFCNNDRDLLYLFLQLLQCDTEGRIKLDTAVYDEVPQKDDISFLIKIGDDSLNHDFKEPEKNDFVNIHFCCGVPGVGKDFYAEQFTHRNNIISFDKIRVWNYQKSEFYNPEKSPVETYTEAFQYCIDNDINLDQELLNQVKLLLTLNHRDIYICNTFTVPKSRKRLINIIKNYIKQPLNFNCHYIMSDIKTILRRNKKRSKTDKHIPIDVIDNFLYRQSIPTLLEGFTNINFIINNKQKKI